jgi:hypothetical protein
LEFVFKVEDGGIIST